MEELLAALKRDDRTAINEYAIKLLVTKDNKLNRVEAQVFERFAPCIVVESKPNNIFKLRCYVGYIIYNKKQYGFG